MVIMYGILILFILSVFLISVLNNNKEKSLDELDNKVFMLEEQIKQKQLTLNRLENQNIDKSVHLSKIEIEVLDIYEKSNIRIPADILEDLSSLQFTEPKEVFDYIENQRNFWKLENSKKPYKKG